jgi:hypothetical protein
METARQQEAESVIVWVFEYLFMNNNSINKLCYKNTSELFPFRTTLCQSLII